VPVVVVGAVVVVVVGPVVVVVVGPVVVKKNTAVDVVDVASVHPSGSGSKSAWQFVKNSEMLYPAP
jgi:hypothetical protein